MYIPKARYFINQSSYSYCTLLLENGKEGGKWKEMGGKKWASFGEVEE